MKCVLFVVFIFVSGCNSVEKMGYHSIITEKGKQLPIVIIIPSYNNEQWCIKNISSALEQDYSNYRIIYVDDCSTDDTYTLVEDYVAQYDNNNRITLIHNEERKGGMANYYNAIHMCEDYIIIVTIDGDDWLPHSHVLSRLNEVYSQEDIFLTYGSYSPFPKHERLIGELFPPDVIQDNNYRGYGPFISTHLRTFYAGLFKKIKLEDFLYEDQFFPVAWDVAFMIPMLEMINGKFKRISEEMYVYNTINPISDGKHAGNKQGVFFTAFIRNKQKYQPLINHELDQIKKEN